MKYTIIEVETIDGVQEHIVLEVENGGIITFPKLDSNSSYAQFKLDLAKEQK
jgi:hypothetical protein